MGLTIAGDDMAQGAVEHSGRGGHAEMSLGLAVLVVEDLLQRVNPSTSGAARSSSRSPSSVRRTSWPLAVTSCTP
jgi:hypothetical protein